MVALWPVAQLAPLSHLFGFGKITLMLLDWLSDWCEQPIDLATWITNDAQLSTQQYWITEKAITACDLIGAGLTLQTVLRKDAPKIKLIMLLILLTSLVKAFASALLFIPGNTLVWLTSGALTGLLNGATVLIAMGFALHMLHWLGR
ncbi:MAG: hypothetical protein H7240_10565 [Glaciimonas sp.]|nr:hypothetical protein [Glaciimonas sp.]